MDKQLNLNK